MQKFWQSAWFNLTHITFKGRTSRKEYWYWFLFGMLFSFAVWFFVTIPASLVKSNIQELSVSAQLMVSVYLFAASIITICFSIWKAIADITTIVRRFHDFGKSAWWTLLLYWVIAIGSVLLTSFIFSIIPGCKMIGLLTTQLVLMVFCFYYVGISLFKKGDEGENEYGLPSEF